MKNMSLAALGCSLAPIEERNPYYVELKGLWRVCTPETARAFPAVGYHFARIVHETTGVPVASLIQIVIAPFSLLAQE